MVSGRFQSGFREHWLRTTEFSIRNTFGLVYAGYMMFIQLDAKKRCDLVLYFVSPPNSMESKFFNAEDEEKIMGYPTKVQLIQRKKGADQWYINFPTALAEAMDFSKGEIVHWHIADRTYLILHRDTPAPAPIDIDEHVDKAPLSD